MQSIDLVPLDFANLTVPVQYVLAQYTVLISVSLRCMLEDRITELAARSR